MANLKYYNMAEILNSVFNSGDTSLYVSEFENSTEVLNMAYDETEGNLKVSISNLNTTIQDKVNDSLINTKTFYFTIIIFAI